MGECAEGLPWPTLDRVRVLGLPGRIDPASVVFETLSPGKIHPATTRKLSPSQVRDPESLTVPQICILRLAIAAMILPCAESLRPELAGAGTVTVLFKKWRKSDKGRGCDEEC